MHNINVYYWKTTELYTSNTKLGLVSEAKGKQAIAETFGTTIDHWSFDPDVFLGIWSNKNSKILFEVSEINKFCLNQNTTDNDTDISSCVDTKHLGGYCAISSDTWIVSRRDAVFQIIFREIRKTYL